MGKVKQGERILVIFENKSTTINEKVSLRALHRYGYS